MTWVGISLGIILVIVAIVVCWRSPKPDDRDWPIG